MPAVASNVAMVMAKQANMTRLADERAERLMPTLGLLGWASSWPDANPAASMRKLGMALASVGRFSEAVAPLKIAATRGSNVIAMYWLGVTYEALGEHGAAVDAWVSAGYEQKALEEADSLFNAGRLDEANQQYGTVVSSNSHVMGGLLGLGRIAFLRANWADADRFFSDALKVSSNNPEALVGLAKTRYYGQRRQAEAYTLIRSAIANAPDCYWCYLELADMYIDSGAPDPVRELLPELEAHKVAGDAVIYLKLVEAYLGADRPIDARDTAMRGISRYPQSGHLYFWLAKAQARLGAWEAARTALEEAEQLAPNDANFFQDSVFK